MSQPLCEICNQPMPEGEEMFKYHGSSGPCPESNETNPTTPQGMNSQEELKDFKQRAENILDMGLTPVFDVIGATAENKAKLFNVMLKGLVFEHEALIEARERVAELALLDEFEKHFSADYYYQYMEIDKFIATKRQSLQQKKGEK